MDQFLKQCGFLQTTGDDENRKYYFMHLTFQEYFAGYWISHHMENKKVATELEILKSDWKQFQIVLCFTCALYSNRISKYNPNSTNNPIRCTSNFGYNASTGFSPVISNLIRGNMKCDDRNTLDDITIRLFFEIFFTKLHSKYISFNYLSYLQVGEVKCTSISKYTHYCIIRCLNIYQIEKLDMKSTGFDPNG